MVMLYFEFEIAGPNWFRFSHAAIEKLPVQRRNAMSSINTSKSVWMLENVNSTPYIGLVENGPNRFIFIVSTALNIIR